MDEVTRVRRNVLRYPSPWRRIAAVCEESLRQFWDDACMNRAAAISYSTVLTIVPLMVVILMFVAYFAELDKYKNDITNTVIETIFPFSASTVPLTSGAGLETPGEIAAATEVASGSEALSPASEATEAAKANTEIRLSAVLSSWVDEFVSNASKAGLWGAVLFVLFSMMLVSTIEESFNAVWRSRRRGWYTRIINYWTTLTLAPLFLVGSIVLNEQMKGHYLGPLTVVIPFLVSLLGFWVLFSLVPATRVKFLAALAGAVAAAVLWEVAKVAFAWYLSNYTGMYQIYTTFFVVPIAFMWVYYTWLVILFGVELSYVTHYVLVARGGGTETPEEVLTVDRETLEEMRRMRDRIDDILVRQQPKSES